MSAVSLTRSTIQAALGGWFAGVTGLEPRAREASQHWGGTWDPARAAAPVMAHGVMFLKVVRMVGDDRRYYVVNLAAPLGEEIERHVAGARELLWEIQVWSASQDLDADAEVYLEKVRNLLGSESAIEAFSAVGLGLQGVSGVVDLTETQRQRRVSIAQIDVTLNGYIDVEDSPIGYVDQFEIESQFKAPGGGLLPPGAQISGLYPEVLPP